MDCKTKNICIDEAVTVRLWNTENMSENILQSRLDKKQKICTYASIQPEPLCDYCRQYARYKHFCQ